MKETDIEMGDHIGSKNSKCRCLTILLAFELLICSPHKHFVSHSFLTRWDNRESHLANVAEKNIWQ